MEKEEEKQEKEIVLEEQKYMDEQTLETPKTKEMSNQKKEIWRAVKYVLFSLSAGAIQIVSSLLLKLVILDYVIPADATIVFIWGQSTSTFIADTIGLALSVIWNFTFNRKFTFKAANNVPIAMLLAFVFYIPFYPFQTWFVPTIEGALTDPLGEAFAYIIALVICMIINFILEFIWQTFVVFRKSIDTNVKKEGNNNKETENDNKKEAN